MKQRLIALIQAHTTPQTAALAPMILMALASMSESDVAEMVSWLRVMLAGLEEA